MIVITGNMNYPPNVDAVEVFCRDIFPLVCRRVPSANLWLVGSNPSAVRHWTKNQQIKVTGFVPDIRPYLSRAMVSVCVVHLNVGTQTKVLEAMASGTPVVTTSAGNHGVGAISGRHLYVADSSEEFAERVVTLLNGDGWMTLSENGRKFVVENFAWQKSAAKLESILKQVVQSR
jgi:glycosyltransferase involved in cell wall biosynthesis